MPIVVGFTVTGLAGFLIAAQAILLSLIVLILSPDNRKANHYLSLFLLLQAFCQIGYALLYTDLSVPGGLYYLPTLSYLAASVLYLYVRLLTQPGSSIPVILIRWVLPLVPRPLKWCLSQN